MECKLAFFRAQLSPRAEKFAKEGPPHSTSVAPLREFPWTCLVSLLLAFLVAPTV